jgi:hypothetical protein
MRFLKRVELVGFDLEPGERGLIRCEIVVGDLLATNAALHISIHQPQSRRRIEWWQVRRVAFDPERARLQIDLENDQLDFVLTGPSLLPETVRERVTATILTSIIFAPGNHNDEARAIISLRRRPTKNGEVTFTEIDWQGAPSESLRAQAELRGQWLRQQAHG